MSRNRIGIEVQVQFPTVKELQSELARKWASVKNNFEAKINVGIDGNSLRQLKGKINRVLDDQVFDIKINADISQAHKTINGFYKELEKLDKKLSQNRELKIDLKGIDLDKSFRDVLKDVEKIDKVMEGQTKALKSQNSELDKQVGTMTKMQRIQKTLKDGSIAVTNKMTEKGALGHQQTTTVLPDGRVNVDTTVNREKALKEIEDVMKNIHSINKELIKAEGQYAEKLQQQKKLHEADLALLSEGYEKKYKMNSLEDESIKNLANTQSHNLELLGVLKKQKEEKERISQEEKEIAKAISQVANLESKKGQLQKNAVTATKEESKEIRSQFQYYNNIQQELMRKHNLQSKMTDAQKAELANIKTINSLELRRAKTKKQEKEDAKRLSQEEKERQRNQAQALKELTSNLREVHSVELQIEAIKSKAVSAQRELNSQERYQIELLETSLNHIRQQGKELEKHHGAHGNITNEIREQLRAEESVLSTEKERVRNLAEVHAKQEKVADSYKEVKSLTDQINRLQRDLIYAGMREQGVIEDQVEGLKEKRKAVLDGLDAQEKTTQELKQQISLIERQQNEQRELNRRRQDAREKDQAFNDTGGLIDPFQYYNTAEQAGMAVFDSVKRLDEALVGVQKVAEGTEEQFAEFASSSYDTATALGVTADEYILAVEKWVTAGKTLTESQELAKTSMIGAFVGNISPDDMVKYMSVPMVAFREAGLESSDVINVMNETANNHAIEMDELGKAYVRSANTAKDAGVSFEELTGMITGAQEATRKGGERIGTGIKSMAINVSNIFSQLTGQNRTKYDWFKDIGVDFADANGEMKSMTEILGELAGAWDGMTEAEKGTAKFYLAGKEHAETMGAIIDQWDDSVASTMTDANFEMGQGEAGSAYIEHAKQADSVKFKIAELKNAWDELMYTVGGGQHGVVKVMDAMVNGLEVINDLATNKELLNALKWIFAGMGMHAGINLFKRFRDTLMTGFDNYRRNIKSANALLKENASNLRTIVGLQGKANKGKVRVSADGSKDGKSKDKGSSGGGSTVVTGVGSRVERKKKGKNVNSQDDTTIITGTRSAKQADKKATSLGKESLKSAGKLGGKVLSLLPLVGDAIILLEILGVDALGKLGKGVDKLVTTADELKSEAEEEVKQTLAKNKLLNGEVAGNEKKFDGLETHLKDSGVKVGKNGKLSGHMDSNEFEEFKAQYDAMANELGLMDENGVLIEIEMNDTEEIEEKLKLLNEKLLEIKENALQDLSGDVIEQKDTIDDAREKWGEQQAFLDQYKEDLKELQEVEASLEKKKKENGGLDSYDESTLSAVRSQMAGLESDISMTSARINEQKEIVKTASDGIGTYANKLVDYVKQGGNISDMGMDKEAVKAVLGEMGNSYNKLMDDINLAKNAQKTLKGSQDMTLETWKKLQSAYPQLKGIHVDEVNSNKEIRNQVAGVVSEEGKKKKASADAARTAIEQSAGYIGAQVEMESATGKVKSMVTETGKEITRVYDEADDPPSPTITIFMKIAQGAKNIWNKLFGGGENSVSVKANVKEGSMALGGSTSSQSVSSAGGSLVGASTTVASVDSSKASSKSKSKTSTKAKKEVDNTKVSSDIWRYWKTEMGIEKLADSISDLDTSISNAGENYDKMIKLIKKQNTLISQELSLQKTLKNQKQSEMNSTLKSLRKYGFKTKGNNITNLGKAKSFKGEKATKVEDLLNTWKGLNSDLLSIGNSIDDLNNTMRQNKEEIKEANIAKELKSFEKQLKRIDATLKKVSNSDSITEQRLGLLNDADKELALIENEKAMLQSKTNMKSLITEFNKLSKAKIKYGENAEELQGQLDSLASEILSQADAVIEYQNAINELEFDRVVSDLDTFTNAVGRSQDRISDVVENLQDGLLSGQKLSDLESSKGVKLNLGRDNQYEKLAKERISLEKEVQQALEAFAKKNVDRSKKVANYQLDIEAKKYNQMLKMSKDYTKGRKASYKKIKTEFDNLASIGAKDEDYKFVDKIDDAYNALASKQSKLQKTYQANLKKAKTQEKKELLTNNYIIDNLKLQEEYYKASITANRRAISELQKQLKDSSLDDDTAQAIRDQIADYEDEIIDAQNNIKKTIESRFEFEFSLIEEAVDAYDKYGELLEYNKDILDAIGGENYTQQEKVLRSMLSLERKRNRQIRDSLASLNGQLRKYEEGSYEWQLINAQVEEYNELLRESNLELLEMNKNILSSVFEGRMNMLEKKLFKGKTLDEFEAYQDLWMDGLEREIALEDAYQRLADLGTQNYDQKMALLSRQEKLSRFEMDYLNKQLDVLELQQKIDNLNREKTVQTLKQNADGTWDWTYEADASELSDAQEELKDAQLELEKAKDDAQKEYLSALEDILSNAENGLYESAEEMKKAINDLNDAFSSVIGDSALTNVGVMIKAYEKYLHDNKDVVDDAMANQRVTNKSLSTVSYEITSAIGKIGSDITKAINNYLSSSLPHMTTPSERVSENKSVSITLEKLEFPNVKNADGLKDAIMSLPQIALQKSKGKL